MTKKELIAAQARERADRIAAEQAYRGVQMALQRAEDKLRTYTRVLRPAIALVEWDDSTLGASREEFRDEHPHYAKTRDLRCEQFWAQLRAEIHILGYGFCDATESGEGHNTLSPPAGDCAGEP